jgi:hypothetical protein
LAVYRRAKDDTKQESHALDLNLSGRKIGNVGLLEVVAALQDTLDESRLPCFNLEELNLSDNDLTAASLACLTPVIKLSKYHIKDVNLAKNNISIKDEADAQAFEEFLDSFAECRAIRLLIFSQNDFSGPRAMETLCRVYSRHPAIDSGSLYLSPLDSITGNVSITESSSPLSKSTTKDLQSGISSPEDPFAADPMSAGTILQNRRGLRSIAFIVLADVKLTDSGALWLSYVLTEHLKPEALLSQSSHVPSSILKGYGEATNCTGVVYRPCDSLTSWGVNLLVAAERRRERLQSMNDETESAEESYVVVPSASKGDRLVQSCALDC